MRIISIGIYYKNSLLKFETPREDERSRRVVADERLK
jgi:hypothetical protein